MEFRLTDQQRDELTQLAKRPTVQHRIARRANALVLVDRGMSCAEVASVLLMDEDTIRGWVSIYAKGGVAALERLDGGGSACDMTDEQIRRLADWVDGTVPASTRVIDAGHRRVAAPDLRAVLFQVRPGQAAGARRAGLAQARSGPARGIGGDPGGVHPPLREAAERPRRRRGGDVHRRGPSGPS